MQLKRRRVQWDVETLLNKVKRGEIEVPRFQRGKVWNRKKRSEAIYSLLTIGLPDIVLIEGEGGKYLLLDGLQRISAVSDFIEGAFKIGLDDYLSHIDQSLVETLEGKKFEELPEEVKRELLGAELGAVVYSGVNDFEIAKEIFTRINYKPTPLNQQELLMVLTYDKEKTPLLKEFGDKLSPRRLKGFGILSRVIAGYTLLREGLKEEHFNFNRYYDWLYRWLRKAFRDLSVEKLESLLERAMEFIEYFKGIGVDVVKAPYWSDIVAFLLLDSERENLPPLEYWNRKGRQRVESLRKDPDWIKHVAERNKQKPATLRERFEIAAKYIPVKGG